MAMAMATAMGKNAMPKRGESDLGQRMKVAHPLRLAGSFAVGIALLAGLAMQSIGMAVAKTAPEIAIATYPFNGKAYENIASAIFLTSTEATGSPEQGASIAKEMALGAYRREPLTPKAQAILALARNVSDGRAEVLQHALALNRREPRLQAVILQEQVRGGEYSAAIASLDRILRVRPSRHLELFPVLLDAFSRKGAVGEFAKILDGSTSWHHSFFRYAADQPTALLNMAALRKRTSFHSQSVDRLLLWNLVREGEMLAALSLYKTVSGTAASVALDNKGPWVSDFAPFDWSFADKPGLRAQPSLTGNQLEISVKPGNGGVVARRTVATPDTPFLVVVDHKITSKQVLQDINIALRCLGEISPLISANLVRQGAGFQIDDMPDTCSFVEVTISARAWTGRSAVSEEIEAVRIVDR